MPVKHAQINQWEPEHVNVNTFQQPYMHSEHNEEQEGRALTEIWVVRGISSFH